ncbi:hypothetical protein KFE94_11630 [bacterium SCSIO 12643]|nr:hypothetical protein KFE94_11630 [bacterium SCSIO 12643]
MKNLLILTLLFLTISCKKERILDDSQLHAPLPQKSEHQLDNTISLTSCYNEDNSANPVGGGEGYDDIVIEQPNDHYIYSELDFIDLFQTGLSSNMTIHIKTDLDVQSILNNSNLTLPFTIPIGVNNVTISGDRGQNGSNGPLITVGPYITVGDPVFRIRGNNCRITGIQMKGSTCECESEWGGAHLRGIEVYNASNARIDNCEISCFPHSGVTINNNGFTDSDMPLDIKVDHNYFHDNAFGGLGYGVQISYGFVHILKNLFNRNRHCIAGRGSTHSGYEASCNIILEEQFGVNMDMHRNPDQMPFSSRYIYIHHNEFRDKGDYRKATNGCQRNTADVANIGIQGRPQTECRITNNIFYNRQVYFEYGTQWRGSIGQDYNGNMHSNHLGNMIAFNNIYGQNSYLGYYVHQNWDKDHLYNWWKIPSTNDMILSLGGSTMGTSIITFGNFDNDMETEIFKSENGTWSSISYTPHYNNDWTHLATSQATVSDLQFGHFDSDDQTDAFYTTGSVWEVSSGASSPWATINTSGYTLPDLLFGKWHDPQNVKDDQILDVFHVNSGNFDVSYDGQTNWSVLTTSNAPQSLLYIGEFNNDNFSDILFTQGTYWQVSYGNPNGGTANWQNLTTSSKMRHELWFGDMNHDGNTDVMSNVNGGYSVSIDGTQTWKYLNTGNYPLSSFLYGAPY